MLRQTSDKMFLNFLNDVRYKDPNQADIDSCLGSCYVPEEEALSFIDRDTTIICLHRDKVAYYNVLSLMFYFLTDKVETVEIKSNVSGDPNLEKWKKSYKFHQLTHVAIGCKVLLTANIDLKLQAANSSEEIVSKILKDEDGLIDNVVIKLSSNNKKILITRTLTTLMRIIGHRQYSKSTFPLILGYAITTHKVEGVTITGKVFLVLTNAFVAGLAYVMLSRVTNRKNLHIIGKFIPKDLQVFRS
jgi:hypothetical protein